MKLSTQWKKQRGKIANTLTFKELDVFGEDERLKMATFILEYDDDNQDQVPEQDAKVLVEQWRKSLG